VPCFKKAPQIVFIQLDLPLGENYNREMKKKIMIVYGTRPELIKLAPVIHVLQADTQNFEVFQLATAQHRQMLDQMLEIFNLKPDRDLNIMQPNQSLSQLTASVMEKVTALFQEIKPQLVMIQGDTTTAMVSALAAFYQKISVAHVEAGLRTGDIYNPFPEEINRKVVGTLASFHFPPTDQSAANLIAEGVAKAAIAVTGNTVVDALQMIAPRLESLPLPVKQKPGQRMILVTAHRRENFGAPLEDICQSILKITQRFHDVEFVYPVHPNPNVREKVSLILGHHDRIHLLEPLNYIEFLALMKKAFLILSDSGGVQEEAPTYGKPVLVMRQVTERPEGVQKGVARLVGTDQNRIIANVSELLTDPLAYQQMSQGINPYGDGKAALKIRDFLLNAFPNA
jgi:UDP-N-acetylglucosamine 2-epimerase (non-hydrolysing)